MNRKERRRIANKLPRGMHKAGERELKRRQAEKYSDECTFDHHKRCTATGCGCPHHTSKVKNGEGRIVEDIEVRDTGLYVARRPGIIRPGGGSGVEPQVR